MEGERVEEMGGMGFVARCFPACPMLPPVPVRELAGGPGCLFLFGSHTCSHLERNPLLPSMNELCALAFRTFQTETSKRLIRYARGKLAMEADVP